MEKMEIYVVIVLHQDRQVLLDDLDIDNYDRIEYMTPYLADAKNYYDNISYRDFRYHFVKPLRKFIIRTNLQKEHRNGIINEDEVFSDVIEDVSPEQLAFEMENF